MRLGRLGLVVALASGSPLALVHVALAQVPTGAAPAAEPKAPVADAPAAAAPGEGAQVITPEPPPAPPEAPPTPTPESAPAPDKTPETAPAAEPPAAPAAPLGPAKVVAPTERTPAVAAPTRWVRARSPLTLEGRLGLLLRPESAGGFDSETHAGAELGLSLYWDLKREFSVGLELDRASLGRGTALTALDSVSIDYTVSSAMLGARAYPWRSEMVDLFVGLQVGVGVQGVSAQGTANNGALQPASSYSCGASDAPAFQLGGGAGARLMISPRWGITGRVNAVGRRTSGELIEACAQGIGTATTITASLGLGYDFDLDP